MPNLEVMRCLALAVSTLLLVVACGPAETTESSTDDSLSPELASELLQGVSESKSAALDRYVVETWLPVLDTVRQGVTSGDTSDARVECDLVSGNTTQTRLDYSPFTDGTHTPMQIAETIGDIELKRLYVGLFQTLESLAQNCAEADWDAMRKDWELAQGYTRRIDEARQVASSLP